MVFLPPPSQLWGGEMRLTFWNRATRDNEETTQCGWLTVSGRDIFISSRWGAAFNRLSELLFIPIYFGTLQFPLFVGFFDVHILKGPPGLFSNPEVKLERVYGVVTWETSGEMCMTSNLFLLFGGFKIFSFALFVRVEEFTCLKDRFLRRCWG